MRKYINAILSISSVLMLFYIIHNQRQQIAAKQTTIDSLQTELFISNANLGRYEMTLELMYEKDIQAATEFEKVYNNQTE